MIGVEFLREVIETTILTGKIASIEPVSLLLIAAPESGKTSVILSKNCKAVQAFTDVTGRGLHEICKNNPDLTHIVINDMVALLSHKESVNRYTLSQLNAITEEGITSIATPRGIETFPAGRRGVITSLTLDLTKDSRRWWNKVGFTSRMLPFCYVYSPDLIIRIKEDIDLHAGKNGATPIPKNGIVKNFLVPVRKLTVEYPSEIKNRIRVIADVRSVHLKEQGMRRLKQYHAMALAHAVWRNKRRSTVTDKEVDFMKKLDLYVSYDNPERLQ